jgi:putative phage-type endonuclease
MDDLNYIIDIVKKDFEISDLFDYNEKIEFIDLLHNTILTFSNISISKEYLHNILFENMFRLKSFIPKTNLTFLTVEEFDNHFDNLRKFILIPSIYKFFSDQYEKLINIPQPVQKSKEWFDLRNNMITASSCGAIIGESKYESVRAVLIDKLGYGEKFKENKFVYHGKKYEKIAIMIYERIYNSKIGEFGLIQHPNIPYLGASPDGISMNVTLDGSFNNRVGRMLEIKCPLSRKILNKGKIKGDICPDYYWVQVQMQLECCNLEECDFWQCSISEYDNRESFLNDKLEDTIHTDSYIKLTNSNLLQDLDTENNGSNEIKIDNRIKKGVIIELYPVDTSNVPKFDKIEWYSKYIYPPSILMTEEEYKNWYEFTINNINTLYPEYTDKYKFNKLLYWKLDLSHNELITRNKIWFESNKHKFQLFWNRVLFYRNNKELIENDILQNKFNHYYFYSNEDLRLNFNNIFIKNNKKKPTESLFLSSD